MNPTFSHNAHPVHKTHVMRISSSAIYFKVCCDASNTPQNVGILFFSGEGDTARSGTYCIYLRSYPHRLVKFPHNTEIIATLAEARDIWATLSELGWKVRLQNNAADFR